MVYESLRRRPGPKRAAGTPDRRVPADLHRGTYRDFLRRHEDESAEAAAGTRAERNAFARHLFPRVADDRDIRCAIDHLADEGGQSPGPDGKRLVDLDDAGRWEMARGLSGAVREGAYRPGPHREVAIPKASGRGTRTLKVQNVEDRVVQRAIVQVLQPVLDPTFSDSSLGYRPGKGRELALRKPRRSPRVGGSGPSSWKTSATPSTRCRARG